MAITGLNVGDNPQPGLSIGRCLRRAGELSGLTLLGITYDLQWTGVHDGEVFEAVHMLPPPWLDEETFVKRLLGTCREAGVRAILPCLDADIAVLARHQDAVHCAGVRTFGPTRETLDALWGLWGSAQLVLGAVTIPRSAVAYAGHEIPRVLGGFAYPLVLRSAVGEIAKVATAAEAHVVGGRFLQWWGGPLVFREWIEGEDYQVVALASKGALLGAVGVKVLTRGSNGSVWAVVTVADADLVACTRAILGHTRWTGPLLLEFVKETWSGRVWLMGTSPRFPVWVEAARAAGQNLPAVAVEMALKGRINRARQPGAYEAGLVWAMTSRDEISDVAVLAELGNTGRVARGESLTVQGRRG